MFIILCIRSIFSLRRTGLFCYQVCSFVEDGYGFLLSIFIFNQLECY